MQALADRARAPRCDWPPGEINIPPENLVVDMLLMRICGSGPGRWEEGYRTAGGSPESLWLRIASGTHPNALEHYERAMVEAILYSRVDCASLLYRRLGVRFVNYVGQVESIESPAVVRLLGKWGGVDPQWLLERAAIGNNIPGMRVARSLGATNFRAAIRAADRYGRREALPTLSLWIYGG